jgi:hypothetical protein
MPRLFAPIPRIVGATLLTVALVAVAVPAAAQTFEATAEFESERTLGTSRIPFRVVIDRTTPFAEARALVELLGEGGQAQFRAAIAGRDDGRIDLGALEYRVGLAVMSETAEGLLYSLVTERPLRRAASVAPDETAAPFGVLRFLVDDSGSAEGFFLSATGLALDEKGGVVAHGVSEPGRLLEMKRID